MAKKMLHPKVQARIDAARAAGEGEDPEQETREKARDLIAQWDAAREEIEAAIASIDAIKSRESDIIAEFVALRGKRGFRHPTRGPLFVHSHRDGTYSFRGPREKRVDDL